MIDQGRIGIDLGGTKIEGVLMDVLGRLSIRERIASPSQSYSAIVDAIVALVRELEASAVAGADTPVGIGTPGAWQADVRSMKNCNSTVLNGRPLFDDLIERLGNRVRLANDANCFALSEAVDGAAAGADPVFGVILGTGVGGGIVVSGKLVTGINAIAGEWGHTPVSYLRHPHAPSEAGSALQSVLAELPDRRCYCGRLNCVETFLAGPGLELTAQQLLDKKLAAAELFDLATRDDADAIAVREHYVDLLARSLAQVINVLDPESIVLGGGISQQPYLYERLPELLPRYAFSPQLRTQLVPPVHGDSSGVRGAAWLWPPSAE